jgi:hypothetical protein
MIAQVVCVIFGTMDETRFPTSQKINTKQVHPRCIYNTAIVTNAPLPVEHGHMKPIVIRMETGRPQYGSYIAVREVNL